MDKKLWMKLVLMIIVIKLFVGDGIVFANPIKYETKPLMKNVEMEKEFEIKFSEELNPETVNSNYFEVYTDDDKETPVSIYVEQDIKDKRVVKIRPFTRFKQGKRYKIVVAKGVKSINGETLSKAIIIPFEVKNFYAGLPVEDGLIIIGNEAYSIGYLVNNAARKNEILKGSYKVFYVDDNMKNKIKDVVGGNFVDGTQLPPGYNFRKPMYYIDPNGKRIMYIWDWDKSEFKKVEPALKVHTTVTSKEGPYNKVLMVQIKEVQWLDGVAYYKLDTSNTYYKVNEPIIFTSKNSNERVTLYSSSMTKLAEGSISGITEGIYTVKLKVYEKTSDGNSAGNIVNNGYVAADEKGYVLYNNTGDKNKLYKYDTNGIFHSVISDDFAQYINVADEWVYYSNYSDKGKLYRMRIDGSEKQKLNDEYSAFINIVGDDIYYSNYSDNGRITKIKKDGSGIITDNKGEKHGVPLNPDINDEAFFLNIVGEWIYYSNISDHHRVYGINMSGKYRVSLSDEGASSIQVVGEWIYYTNNKGKLKKVKKDGSRETEELGGVVAKFDRGFFFNVVDEWIYYSNAEDSNRLYKIKTDGTENTRLTFESVTYINIAYNTIYFVSKGDMYTVPIDTNGRIKPVAVKKIISDKKVVQVDNLKVIIPYDEVNETIESLEAKYLPTKVPGIMSDNRMQQFVVQWDKKNIAIRNGVRTYKGKLIGYDQYIELTMRIPSEMLNETTTIAIYNNSGTRNGYIEVYSNPVQGDELNIPPKLREGDELKLYEDKDLTKLLRTTTVSRQGIHNKGIFNNVELDRYGTKEYYISIKRQGKAESKGTKFTVGEAPGITNSIHKPVRDIDEVGLGIDGRDFYIEEMKTTNNKAVISSHIYLTIKGTQLRLQSDKIVPFDSQPAVGYSWIGRRYQDSSLDDKVNYPDKERMNTDSFGNLLIGTNYDLFLVSKYLDKASEDNRGQSPNIIGWATSEPASIVVKSEDLPYDPGLETQTKKYGETITLRVTPKPGETAYLIPVWESKFEAPGVGEYVGKGYKEYIDATWLKDAKTWLDDAKVWLKENGQWPFDETGLLSYAVENGYVTKLEGDGSSRIMPVPTGFKYEPNGDSDKMNSRYYAPNIKYKLVIINDIGVSSVSNGTLTVDNKPPVVVEEFIQGDEMYIKSGEPITFQSKYENADVYISYTLDNLTTIENLEEAVAIKAAYKFSVLSGVTTLLPTDAIKPYVGKDSLKYKIMVADQIGNLREVGIISIYVDIEELEQVRKDAVKAVVSNSVLELVQDQVDNKKKEVDAMMEKINSKYRTDIVTQREVDKMVNDFRLLMIDMGIPHKNDNLETYDKITMIQNFLRELRLFNNHSAAVDLNEIRENIWLPTEFGYQQNIGGAYDYKFNIEWDVKKVDGNDTTTTLIETKDPNNMGSITRPLGGDEQLKLIAKYRNAETGTVLGEKEYYITIKGKKFITRVTVPLSNKAVITLEGVDAGSTGEKISVKVLNNGAYEDTIEYDGVTYSFTIARNSNGIDWDVIVNALGADNGELNGTEIPIRITVDNVTIDNQVKLKITNEGLEPLIMGY